MIPRSAAEGHDVNSRNVDEFFPKHGNLIRGKGVTLIPSGINTTRY